MYLSKDLSFTKTAERCYISQSVLSRHIQALEAELGCELLVRDKRGLRLTPYGESFAESCKKIDIEYSKALADLDNVVGGFTEILRIAYVSPLPAGFIDKAYEMQLERYPEVKLDLMATWEERAVVLLNQSKVNLSIFIVFEDPDPAVFNSLTLFKDRYVLLVPKEDALAQQASVRLSDLQRRTVLIPSAHDFPIQYAHIRSALKLVPEVAVRGSLNSKHDALALANARRGLPLVRGNLIEGMDTPSLAMVPVVEEGLSFDVRAVWRKDDSAPSLVGFVDILKELTGETSVYPAQKTL